MVELGMTPAARSRVAVTPGSNDDYPSSIELHIVGAESPSARDVIAQRIEAISARQKSVSETAD